MNESELKRRTKQFALRVIRLCGALPKGPRVEPLLGEANELTAIMVSSYRTSQQHSIKNHKSKIKNP